ncbi:MAG: hypothetical protein RBS05_01650 [Zoogloea oleivorans]|jgi:hypothetical protein|uniref:hypothetical protein n=1 Tax=Zoogloea oleivorans TaxID=1552750 RepID=UPI001B509AFA|nr:hypothetical protein [Zoogloea oleivorans]MBP8133206.1 hypothetical protein [Zoogloea sp.]MDY0034595.1 hypothetical protein [Zoogloea oleivorans]
MAAPWFTLFRAIPWSDVINHAPGVAKGAKKLWEKVATRKTTETQATTAAPTASPDQRMAALEARLAEIDARQQDSAELLAALASQNAELVRTTEALRRRTRVLSVGLALILIALLVSLYRAG